MTVPARRFVRFAATIEVAGRKVEGSCSNIGASGMHIRVPTVTAAACPIEHGTEVQVSFALPGEERRHASPATVVWIDPEERDPIGRDAIGIGLNLAGADAETLESIGRFIEGFRYRVLVVGRDAARRRAMIDALGEDYATHEVGSVEEARLDLEQHETAVLVVSPDLEGSEGLHGLRATFVSGSSDPAELPAHVRAAVDRYSLAVENERLRTELHRANERLLRENRYLRQRLEGLKGFEAIVGKSPQLVRSLAELERIRHSEATVHVQGETGTGKELVARALHFGGPRSKGPFLAQNCAGLVESLLQSTLFGHRKGAFTGADRDRTGVFQDADGGTLFLDEVADLTPVVQASLLRALQQREIVPVGDTRPIKVDVRVISATHKNLREEVESGRFREDLYFRLVVIGVVLPPLRERIGDVPILAQHFLDLLCERYGKDIPGFTSDAMRGFEAYAWPGNVRELENEIERLVVLSEEGARIPYAHLSPHIRAAREAQGTASMRPTDANGGGGPAAREPGYLVPDSLRYEDALTYLQKKMIERALADSGGVVSRAADALGIERSRLVKLRQRLGIGRGTG